MDINRDLPLHERTLVMGIVNVTPDSFSDGGEYDNPENAVNHALQLVDNGADILDIGAESTRPGAAPVSPEVELERLEPVISALRAATDVPISIDTHKVQVAARMLDLGADIINDITALQGDRDMVQLVADTEVQVILMHMQGTPETMQNNPEYSDVIQDISHFFQGQITFAKQHGVQDGQIILDPGIGFGKTVDHNLKIIREIPRFKALGYPVLIGASRKSFIGTVLDVPVQDRLEGSLGVAVTAMWLGADIVRVHDVRETVRILTMAEAIRGKKVRDE